MKRLTKKIPYPENLILELLYDYNKPISNDMKEGLHHAITTLSEKQQNMLYMRYAEYQTFEQIAKHFGITKNRARDVIVRALRQLRHPSKLNYVKYGLYYLNAQREEEQQRQERYKNIYKNRVEGVPLSEMEEINAKTYNCLRRKGFNTLNEVNKFIKEQGPEWYRLIPNLGIKSKNEVESAIDLYGLNSNSKQEANNER